MTARKPRTVAQTGPESFASVSDAVAYAVSPCDLPDEMRHSIIGRESFTGTVSLGDAARLAFGWDDGAARVERTRVAIAAHGLKPRNVSRMREVGPGVVSMGAFLSGHPQPYVIIEPGNEVRPGGKIVRIAVNIAASGGIGREVIETRGAAVCAVVDALERAGRRVEVTTVHGVRNGTARLTYRVRVKGAEDKLNLRTVAFALAHGSYLRRIGFSIMEHESAEMRSAIGVIGGGYGSPAEVEDHGADVYLGAMSYGDPNFESEDSARAWVRHTLASQGVTVIDGKEA